MAVLGNGLELELELRSAFAPFLPLSLAGEGGALLRGAPERG